MYTGNCGRCCFSLKHENTGRLIIVAVVVDLSYIQCITLCWAEPYGSLTIFRSVCVTRVLLFKLRRPAEEEKVRKKPVSVGMGESKKGEFK